MLELLSPSHLTKLIVPLNPKAQLYKCYKDEHISFAYLVEAEKGHPILEKYGDLACPMLKTNNLRVFAACWLIDTPERIGAAQNPLWIDLSNPVGVFIERPPPIEHYYYDQLLLLGTGHSYDSATDPPRFILVDNLMEEHKCTYRLYQCLETELPPFVFGVKDSISTRPVNNIERFIDARKETGLSTQDIRRIQQSVDGSGYGLEFNHTELI